MRFIFQNAPEGDYFDYGAATTSGASTPSRRPPPTTKCAPSPARWGPLAAVARLPETLPQPADADEAAYYISMIDVPGRLGVENHHPGSMSVSKPPIHGARLPGSRSCREPPPARARSRYDVWLRRAGPDLHRRRLRHPVGASYLDVLRWLPPLRPYLGPEGGRTPSSATSS